MNGPSDALNQLFSLIQDKFSAYLMAVTSLGVLSMALIQLVKDLFPIKRAYHKLKLEAWMKDRNDVGWQQAQNDLVLLTAPGNERAFYGLETEQLCGQMNSASQVVMENPTTFPDLFKILAYKSAMADMDLILSPSSVENNKVSDSMSQSSKEYLEARNRINHFVQRNIDAFQVVATNSWKWYMRVTALVLSFILSFAGLILFWKSAASIKGVVLALLLAALSSFLAPVARDLVAAIQSLRK